MFGGGAGSILGMIISLKNNRELLSKRKSYRDIRDQYEKALEHKQISSKKADPAYLQKLRDELSKQRQIDNIVIYGKIIFLLIIIIVVVTAILIIFPKNSDKFNTWQTEKLKQDRLQQIKQQDYPVFVGMGKYHFSKGNYSTAIRELKKGIEFNPHLFPARFELAKVYSFLCTSKDTYCDDAVYQYNQLLIDFDTSQLALKGRADLLMHLNRIEEAEKDLERLEELK